MSNNDWGNTYVPHENTIYVGQGTPYEGLAESIVVAFNRRPERGIDVSFMGDVALVIAHKACKQAQAIITDQHPGLSISWKFSRRTVESRKVPGRLDVADFFSLVAGKENNG